MGKRETRSKKTRSSLMHTFNTKPEDEQTRNYPCSWKKPSNSAQESLQVGYHQEQGGVNIGERRGKGERESIFRRLNARRESRPRGHTNESRSTTESREASMIPI